MTPEMSVKMKHGILKSFSLLLILLLAAGALRAASITTVQRGVHDGFELVILNCDTLPDFSLEYDQVQNIFRLQLKHGRISSTAVKALNAFSSRETIADVKVDRKAGVIAFRVKGPVYLREHLVSGPPALILDFSNEPEHSGRYPFELDREQYLRLGGRAERDGKLNLALNYVKHVRRWSDDDANLIHRAGVIEQRLGQWDVALETFAKTAADPSLAADAHARRTMIFMAKGDTLSSGQEWAGYFHRNSRTIKPEVVPDTLEAIEVAVSVPSDQPAKTPFQLIKKVIQAGGGDGSTYLYYGWGMLAVGLVTLIGLWAGSGGSRRLAATEAEVYHPLAPPEAQTEYEFLRALKAKENRKLPARSLLTPESSAPTPFAAPPVPREAPLPSAYQAENRSTLPEDISSPIIPTLAESPEGQAANSTRPPKGKIPIEQIIQLAEEGFKQAEIAQKLTVEKDEVGMVLNLARLYRSSMEQRVYSPSQRVSRTDV